MGEDVTPQLPTIVQMLMRGLANISKKSGPMASATSDAALTCVGLLAKVFLILFFLLDPVLGRVCKTLSVYGPNNRANVRNWYARTKYFSQVALGLSPQLIEALQKLTANIPQLLSTVQGFKTSTFGQTCSHRPPYRHDR